MDGMNRWNEWMEWMNGCIYEWMDGWMCMYVWIDE